MFSHRRFVFLLVLAMAASAGLEGQSSSSSSAQPDQPGQTAQPAQQTSPPLTVQGRIRARREQRRATAIHDVYTHLYEAYVGMGYVRTTPGPGLQKINEYAWNVGFTRYYNQKLGVTLDGRGYYGTAFVGLPQSTSGALTNPSISTYTAMIGPTYRFILEPKYSVSGRILAGGAFGNFSGDIKPFTPAEVGLYSNGASVAISASVPLEYNVSPGLGLRLAPEYTLTNFGSSIQNGLGFTAGFVFRFGKQ